MSGLRAGRGWSGQGGPGVIQSWPGLQAGRSWSGQGGAQGGPGLVGTGRGCRRAGAGRGCSRFQAIQGGPGLVEVSRGSAGLGLVEVSRGSGPAGVGRNPGRDGWSAFLADRPSMLSIRFNLRLAIKTRRPAGVGRC